MPIVPVALHRASSSSSGSSGSPSSSCRNAMRRGRSRAAASSEASRTTRSWSCSTPACSSGAVAEVWVADRPVRPGPRLGHARPRRREPGPALVVHQRPSATSGTPASSSCPGLSLVRRGPYRRHPAPELRRGRRRGPRPPARAHRLGDGPRLHRRERRPARRPHPRRERTPCARSPLPQARPTRSRGMSADVIVIGGGPVGLATALYAVRSWSRPPSSSSRGREPSTRHAARGSCQAVCRPWLDLRRRPARPRPAGDPLSRRRPWRARRTSQPAWAVGVRRTTLHAALLRRGRPRPAST